MEKPALPETNSVRQELSEVPLSDLLALRDRVGTKEFSRVYHNRNKPSRQVPLQKDKERPPEFSSKRPRPVHKRTGDRNRPRDPRFDERAGPFCEDSFGRAYSFLEEVRETERCEVEREVRRAGESADTSQLLTLLDRMRAQARARRERARDREVERRWVKAERERVGRGKRRFYLKRSVLRGLQLEARLGGSGGKREVDKRRKRMEKRSRKKIPQRRGKKGMQTI